jgi:anthranilate/para-aminobenzoate synthase component I
MYTQAYQATAVAALGNTEAAQNNAGAAREPAENEKKLADAKKNEAGNLLPDDTTLPRDATNPASQAIAAAALRDSEAAQNSAGAAREPAENEKELADAKKNEAGNLATGDAPGDDSISEFVCKQSKEDFLDAVQKLKDELYKGDLAKLKDCYHNLSPGVKDKLNDKDWEELQSHKIVDSLAQLRHLSREEKTVTVENTEKLRTVYRVLSILNGITVSNCSTVI